MADGHVEGHNLICGVHNWDYRLDTGVSEYNNAEALHVFESWVDEASDAVFVSDDEIAAFEKEHPQPFHRDEYLGLYQDPHGAAEEPYNAYIQQLARDGLSKVGRVVERHRLDPDKSALDRNRQCQRVVHQHITPYSTSSTSTA